MFYSHEILTNRRNGVATIWLAATVGPRSSARKITKKAIQDVNIPKACLTIIDPGAPIALRLQSNLLYGVSRVYSQQYTYVLTDAERMQAHMQAFYRAWGTNSIDLQADKTTTRSSNLIIPDDPAFELEFRLPEFTLDGDGTGFIAQISQASRKTSSQLSPLDPQVSFASAVTLMGGLNTSESSDHGGYQLQLPFGRESTASQKAAGGGLHLPGEEEILPAFDDWGIEIDADGNVVPAIGEPELPPLPRLPSQFGVKLPQPQDAQQKVDEQGDVVMDMGDEEILPEVEESASNALPSPVQGNSSETASAPLRQRRVRRPVLLTPDSDTKINKQEFRTWNANYIASQEALRNKASTFTGLVKAKQNAWILLFGRGLMDVGLSTGIPDGPYPLAEYFAGAGLAKSIGINIDPDEADGQHGHRRSAEEAFGMEDDNERRVRARLEDGEQVGRNVQQEDELLPIFDHDMEVGREPGSALSDIASSVPWNRPPSGAPGSSVPGSAKAASFLVGRQVSASPLHGRGHALQDIERLSDPTGVMSDGLEPYSSVFGDGGHVSRDGPQDEQLIQEPSDLESGRFLDFVQRIAETAGVSRPGKDQSKRVWVAFEDLFEPVDNKKAVVTQAFFNILSLATRNKIKVDQEGENETPFGTIRLGVLISE